MERHDAVLCMINAGGKFSVAVNDLTQLLLKLIVLSVKFVSRKKMWSDLFTVEDYVDWDLVETQSKKNVLGGCAEWLGVLSFCSWDELVKCESAIQTQHPILQTLRLHMRESNLDTGDTTAWSLACKIFLLMLIQGLPSLHALEVLTCGVFKQDTHKGCISLLAKQVRLCPAVNPERKHLKRPSGRRSTFLRRSSTKQPFISCYKNARWIRRGCSRCMPSRKRRSRNAR